VGIDFGRAQASEPSSSDARMNAVIRILPANKVTFIMPAVEVSQGAHASQSMCIAKELDVGLDQVATAHAPPDMANYGNPSFVVQAAAGSTSVAGARDRLLRLPVQQHYLGKKFLAVEVPVV